MIGGVGEWVMCAVSGEVSRGHHRNLTVNKIVNSKIITAFNGVVKLSHRTGADHSVSVHCVSSALCLGNISLNIVNFSVG